MIRRINLFFIITTFFLCTIIYAQDYPIKNKENIKSIEFEWITNKNIQESNLHICFDQQSTINQLVVKLNNCTKVDPSEIPFLQMIEGNYFFYVAYTNGEIQKLQVISNGSYLTDANETIFYYNKSLYYNIQQILYTKLIIDKRK